MKKAKISPRKDVKLLTLEVINGRYTLVADGKPTEASSTHKYYATSKKALFMGPNTKYEDRTAGGSELAGTSSLDAAGVDNPALAFPIDERFDHLRECVKLVGQHKLPAMLVTGPGGLGKTFTVIQGLKEVGLKDITLEEVGSSLQGGSKSMYKVMKGYTTVKGMYDFMYENRNGLIVFDDCDSAFDDADAANLLKGALDSYDKRIISWNKSRAFADKTPGSFEFTGGIIFISNKPQTKIDQAVRTRCMCVDVSMTVNQILERMGQIIPNEKFIPDITRAELKDAYELIKELKDQIKNLSLRSLMIAARIRHTQEKDIWKKRATFLLLSQS